MTDQDVAADRGRLEPGADGRWHIHFSRHLAHPPERVWAALTEQAQQQRWLPGVTIAAVAGGPVVFDFGEDEIREGTVLAAEPGRLLEHSWQWPDEPGSTVRWTLDPAGAGTVLGLGHAPIRREAAVDHGVGWHVMLDALAVHLAGGDPADLVPDHDHLYSLYTADERRP